MHALTVDENAYYCFGNYNVNHYNRVSLSQSVIEQTTSKAKTEAEGPKSKLQDSWDTKTNISMNIYKITYGFPVFFLPKANHTVTIFKQLYIYDDFYTQLSRSVRFLDYSVAGTNSTSYNRCFSACYESVKSRWFQGPKLNVCIGRRDKKNKFQPQINWI